MRISIKTVLVISALAIMSLFILDYMLEEEFLGKLTSVVTVTSLVLAPAIYFWKKQQDEKNERSQASKNLYTELNDTLDALDEHVYGKNFIMVQITDIKKVYFMNRALNHDFYDSLVFSGKINFLPPEIQQLTQDTFQKIKDHNFFIRKIREIEESARVDEDIFPKTKKFYEILGKTEEELLADDGIKLLKKKLKAEFKID